MLLVALGDSLWDANAWRTRFKCVKMHHQPLPFRESIFNMVDGTRDSAQNAEWSSPRAVQLSGSTTWDCRAVQPHQFSRLKWVSVGSAIIFIFLSLEFMIHVSHNPICGLKM